MPHGIEVRLIDAITPVVRELVTTHARALADLRYADVRLDTDATQVPVPFARFVEREVSPAVRIRLAA